MEKTSNQDSLRVGEYFGSFVFKFTFDGLFKFLFSFVYDGSDASVIPGLVREFADCSLVDKYLYCTPHGPLAEGRSSFGTRCQAFSLSLSGCSQLKLSVTSCFGPGSSTVGSHRARSRSGGRLKRPLVSLRPRGPVGDGNGPLPHSGIEPKRSRHVVWFFFNRGNVPSG